jgi:hypothetical protein
MLIARALCVGLGVLDSILLECEVALTFREIGRVIDLADAGVSSSLTEREAGGRGVSDDVSSNRLDSRSSEHSSSTIDSGYDLVGDDHSHTELVGQTLKAS